MKISLPTLLKNKVVLYVSTRYAVYLIQFIVLLIIASRLDPYNYGIWGFCLMLLGYMRFINFGIANSTNVLLVQCKKDENEGKSYVASAMASLAIIAILLFMASIIYSFIDFPIFEKYNIGILFYVLCLIALIYHINNLFANIYRVYNRLLELSLFQSMVPICLLISVLFLGNSVYLLYYLVGAYFIAHSASLFVFLIRGGIPWGGYLSLVKIKTIFKKGFYLFLYNSCFYLILTTTSSIISYYYSVEEYGYYTFSYSLGHSVLLLLQAFTFVIYPKIIDKLYTSDMDEIKHVLSSIRINYVSFSHGLMYVAFVLFPVFILLFPKYREALYALYLTALAILLSTNSFGYNTLLIAKNKERTSAIISIITLILNIVVGIVLSYYGVPFYCVVFCVMISYLFFSFMCAYKAMVLIGIKPEFVGIIKNIFPFSLMIPYICAIIIAVTHFDMLNWLPLLLFALLNLTTIRSAYKTIRKVCINPDIVNINR